MDGARSAASDTTRKGHRRGGTQVPTSRACPGKRNVGPVDDLGQHPYGGVLDRELLGWNCKAVLAVAVNEIGPRRIERVAVLLPRRVEHLLGRDKKEDGLGINARACPPGRGNSIGFCPFSGAPLHKTPSFPAVGVDSCASGSTTRKVLPWSTALWTSMRP